MTALKWWKKQSKNRKRLIYQTYRFSIGLQNASINNVTSSEIEEIYHQNNAKNTDMSNSGQVYGKLVD